MIDLGQIEKLGVRDHWGHEEQEFTPWLAKDENISKLADALGLQGLQVERVEVPVGPYWADILAKEGGTENYVVIENQFGKTNHDHLGKLLTYAATLGAATVIWVAETFTDEHRKAIEWLNERVSEDLNFYAVEIELWRIDQSRPALRFNVVAGPTEISRQAAAIKTAGPISEAKQLQLEFWTAVRNELLHKKIASSLPTARPQYWFNMSLGRSDMNVSGVANTTGNKIGVRAYISHKVAAAALPQLEAERAAIEAEIGAKLDWNPNLEKRDKVIRLERNADLSDRSKWPEYIAWITDMLAKFRRAFGPRVKKLDLDAAADADDVDADDGE